MANKAMLEATLKATDGRPSVSQRLVQMLELIKNTVDQPATRVDEAEKAHSDFQEHVHYIEDRVSKLSNQLLAKNF